MKLLKALFGKPEPLLPPAVIPVATKYHCIRFMTDRGEQIGMLLTQEEFETGVNRWVQNVSTMPINEEVDEGGVI